MSTSTGSAPSRHDIGRPAALMALGTLLSRLTGLVRSLALTALGIGIVTDTYTVANNTPNIVYELLLGGVLSSTLVPVFVDLLDGQRLRRADEADGWRGVSAVITLAGTLLVALSVLLAVAAPLLIDLFTLRGPDPLKREVATALLRLFAPQVALYGLITVASALLNVRGRFGAPMFAPILNNVVVVAVLLWTRSRLHRAATAGSGVARLQVLRGDSGTRLLLGLGTTAGVAVMAIALVPALRASTQRLRVVWDPRHPAVRRMLGLGGWTLGYVAANMAAYVFVIVVAGRRDADLTAYTQAYSTFYLLPHGLLAVSVMGALQPSLSRAFAERRRGRFRRELHSGMRTLVVLMVPAAVGYVVLARPLVTLLIADRKATLIADLLRIFAFGLPCFSIYLLLMNAAKALRDTRLTYIVNVGENALNIVAAALLYPRYGVRGLAAAFAIAYSVSAAVAAWVLGRRLDGFGGRSLVRLGAQVGAAALVMGVAVWGVDHGVVAAISHSRARGALATRIGVAVVVGVTVYAVLGALAGIGEIRALIAVARGRVVQVGRSRRAGRPDDHRSTP